MRKSPLIIVTMIVLCAAAGAFQAVQVKVKVQLANVRSGPDLGAAVITQLKHGTLLESNGRKGDFYEIAVADESGRIATGYIHANSIEVVSTPAVEPAPAQPEAAAEQAPGFSAGPGQGAPRFAVALTAGYALPSGYGGGIAFGGSFYFGVSRNFGLEIAGFRFQSGVDEPAEEDRETALSEGTLTVMPVQISLVARFPLGAKITPYVLAGAGYFLNKHELDDAVRSGWEGLGFAIEEKLKNSVGFHAGAGIDLLISSKLAAVLSVQYALSTAKGSWSLKEVESGIEATGDIKDITLKPLVFGLGLKYYL